MAGEQVEGLPETLREWVRTHADETGRSADEVLARAVTVYRLLDGDGDALPDPDALAGDGAASDAAGTAGGDPRVPEGVDERLADLETGVAALDADLDEKIDDVRSRVVQVKRETDAKAEADHDHPELREAAESVDGLAEDVAALRVDLDGLEGELSGLEETFEEGFANYEEVLEYLTATADDHGGKLSTLATVLAEVRTRVAGAEAADRRRRAADELRTEANRLGVATASCGSCGGTVRLGLLSAPECPHCTGTFEAVEPASGFFGSATLAVGTRPALEGATVEETTPDDILARADGEGTDDGKRAGGGAGADEVAE